MSNTIRGPKDLKTYQSNLFVMAGTITPSTGSAVLNVSGCLGFSTVRTATGTFVTTFDDQYRGVTGWDLQFASGTARPATGFVGGEVVAIPGTHSVNQTNGTFTWYLCNMSGSNVLQPGRPVDVVGTPLDRVSLVFFASKSSLPRG